MERGEPPGRDTALSGVAVSMPIDDESACSRRDGLDMDARSTHAEFFLVSALDLVTPLCLRSISSPPDALEHPARPHDTRAKPPIRPPRDSTARAPPNSAH